MTTPYTVDNYNLQNYDGAGGFTRTWANWTTAVANCSVSAISEATFQSEQPNVEIPSGHTGTILKVTVDNSGGGSTLSCVATPSPDNIYLDLSSVKNVVMRCHVPYTSLDALNGFRIGLRDSSGGSVSTTTLQSVSWGGEPTATISNGYKQTQAPFSIVFCPQYFLDYANVGTFAGTENAAEEAHYKAIWGSQVKNSNPSGWATSDLATCRIRLSFIAEPNTILTFYVFDILKDVVSTETPKLVLRWDDGSESQYNHLFPIIKKYGVPSVISCPMNDQVTSASGAMSADNAREMRNAGVEFILHSDGGGGELVEEGLANATSRLQAHLNGFDTVFGSALDKRTKKCVVYPGNDSYNQFNEFVGDDRHDLRVKDLMYSLGLRAACGVQTAQNFGWWGETVELDPLIGGGIVTFGCSDTNYASGAGPTSWYGIDSAVKMGWYIDFLNETGAMGGVLMGHIVQDSVPATFANTNPIISGGADSPNSGTSLYGEAGDIVTFDATAAGFTAGTPYYIIRVGTGSGLSGNQFTVSATRGGAEINATATGQLSNFTMESTITTSAATTDAIYAQIHASRVAGDIIPVTFTDFAVSLGIDEIAATSSSSSSGIIGRIIR